MRLTNQDVTRYERVIAADPKMRKVQRLVASVIADGGIPMVYKIKNRHRGGKQLVSAGPFQTATDSRRRYAMFYGRHGEEVEISGSPDIIARRFVAYVGRSLARQAVRELIARS